MKTLAAITLAFALTAGLHAQTDRTTIAVKSSPAEDSLVSMAKQAQDAQKAINDILQQARASLDAKNKPIQDQMKSRAAKYQKQIDDLNAKIADANKDLQAQLNVNVSTAQQDFQTKTAALQHDAVSDQTLEALENIVRKEADLPASATFDKTTQQWSVPKTTASASPDAKK